MKEHHKVGLGIAMLGTAGYGLYVTITHGDGVALAAFIGFLSLIGGYCFGKHGAGLVKKG